MAKRAILQASFYLFYLFALFALPGAILWGPPASALGLIPLLGALGWARLRGYQAVRGHLRCRSLPISEAPQLHHFVSELSRRLRIRPPKIEVAQGQSLNTTLYGFSELRLVVTERALSLPPAHLSALVARSLVRLADGWIPSETLLACILCTLEDALSPSSKRTVSGRNFAVRLLFSMVTLPGYRMLVSGAQSETLDELAAKLCGNPRALSELLRTMERENLRAPHPTSPNIRHLSLYLPEPLPALGKVFLQEPKLLSRIRALEKNIQTQNLIPANP